MVENRRRARRAPATVSEDPVRAFFDQDALGWLAHPNVVGIALGRKQTAGQDTGAEAIVFRVARKLEDRGDILAIGSKPIPAEIEIGGRRYPTDVLEGQYRAGSSNAPVNPKQRFPFICPGVSIGNAGAVGDAGTGTAVVRHLESGKLALLSCDHVLGRRDGNDLAMQPGRADAGRPKDVFGRLLGQMRDLDGDAAVAAIEHRPAEPRIAGLGVAVTKLGVPMLGQKLVKAGRSSRITKGEVVQSIAVTLMSYPDSAPINIRGFEIRPIDSQPPVEGDSGAPWILLDPVTGRPTETLIGIHVGKTPDGKNSFACSAIDAFKRLGIAPVGAELDIPPLERLAAIGTARMPAIPALRVLARSGVALRAGPGVEFKRLDNLPFGATVWRLGVERNWTKVDRMGDGAADGFVHSEFLTAEDGVFL